jgi:hypothetical protein
MSRPGILDSLSPEQQDQLITWMETMPMKAVLERVSSSPPDGFGVKTHITSAPGCEDRRTGKSSCNC